jgi:hypothetical protein
MANSLLTVNKITREAIRLFTNSNAFIQNINRQYNDEFANSGAKIGQTLRIRLPNDYTVTTGKAITPQDTTEQNTSLTVATQKNVPLSFGSAERALSLEDYSERILKPAVNNLVGAVAADIMSGAEAISNFQGRFDGTGVLLTPNADTWLNAGGTLDMMSAPKSDRKIIMDPRTQARTVSTLTGLFNPQQKLSKQYATGMMSEDTLGFDWMMDQTVLKHLNGSFTAGTVNGAGQTGTSVTTNATTGTLNKGDVITIAGVFSQNRVTKQSNGELQQFVVTANVASGATSIPVYPAIIPGNVVYATVTASPANSAVITLMGQAGITYRKNFAFQKDAVTMATVDLEIPKGVHEASRESFDGVSLRIITDYAPLTDDFITRLDILYGYTWVRPEWAVSVPDVL